MEKEKNLMNMVNYYLKGIFKWKKVKFEGEYLNGKKNGKGKEFDEKGELMFEGEYLDGKKWNGKGYNGSIYNIENGKGYVKEY